MAEYFIEPIGYESSRLVVADWAPSIKGVWIAAQTLDRLVKPDNVSSLRVDVSEGMWALAILNCPSMFQIYTFSGEESYSEKQNMSARSFMEMVDNVKRSFSECSLKYDAPGLSGVFSPGATLRFENGFLEARRGLYIPGRGKLEKVGVLAVSSNIDVLEKLAECWKL